MTSLLQRELRARARTPWYAVITSVAIAAYGLLLHDQWRYVTDRGLAVGDGVSTALALTLGVVLLGMSLEAATSIPSDRQVGVLDWLLCNCPSPAWIIGSRAAASLVWASVASAAIVASAALLGVIVRIEPWSALGAVAPAFVAASIHAVGFGLLVGVLARSTRVAVLLVLGAVLLAPAAASIAGWAGGQTGSGPFEPLAALQLLTDVVRRGALVVLPTALFLEVDATTSMSVRIGGYAAGIGQGLAAGTLAAWLLLRRAVQR